MVEGKRSWRREGHFTYPGLTQVAWNLSYPMPRPVVRCDYFEDKSEYDLDIRVRIISVFDEDLLEYNRQLGWMEGPVVGSEDQFIVKLDREMDDDEVAALGEYERRPTDERVKIMGKHFEIVGKREQQKALLQLVQSNEMRIEVLKIMLKAGMSLKERYDDVDGGNILFFTAFSGDKGHCDSLIRLGAETDVKNVNGWTAVMIAASRGKSNAMRSLIEGGAPIDTRNDAGWTALHVAANAGKPKAVKMLLLMGADPGLKNNYNKNCFDIAVDSGNEAVLKVFREHGISGSEDAVRVGDARRVIDRGVEPPREEGGRGAPGRGGRGRRGGRRRSFVAAPPPASPARAEGTGMSASASDASLLSPGSYASQGSHASPASHASGMSDSLDMELSGGTPSPTKQNQGYGQGQYGAQSQPGQAESYQPTGGRRGFTQGGYNVLQKSPGSGCVVDDTASPLPSNVDESLTSSTFLSLAATKQVGGAARRAPESLRAQRIREQREKESSLEYQRFQRELERLHQPEDQRHKTKEIDKDAFTGTYTRDKSRRRSF